MATNSCYDMAKKAQARHVADFRPIASIRLLYKAFSCFIPGSEFYNACIIGRRVKFGVGGPSRSFASTRGCDKVVSSVHDCSVPYFNRPLLEGCLRSSGY